MSCITENKEVSSAKRFALVERPFVRSLMYIKNNKARSMEPWGTPALKFFHVENYPLRIARCFLSFKKSHERFRKFPDLPFSISLKMIPLCHTLSKVFGISKNILLTSSPSSKELYISWLIDNSWLIQELPGLKPDWLEEISLFSLNINLSRISPHIGSSYTGR